MKEKLKLGWASFKSWVKVKWAGEAKDKFILALLLFATLFVTANIIGFIKRLF